MNFFSFCRRGALTGMLLLLGITSAQAADWPRQVTDSYGTHTLPSQPLRIVSTSVTLTGALGLGDLIEDVVLHVEFLLRQQDSHSTGGDGHVQSNITGVAAHDLDHTAAVVALGGVAQLVDHLQRGIHGGIVANGVGRSSGCRGVPARGHHGKNRRRQ